MKSEYLVIVADGTCARFFTLHVAAQPAIESSPFLVERDDLVNIEHKQAGRDKYSSTRTGLNLNPQGGPSHGYDDHRVQQEEAHERRFISDIAAHAASLLQKYESNHVILVAERHVLGLLRNALKIPIKSGINIHDLAKDLTNMTPIELHEYLATAKLIPARHRPKTS